MPSKYYDLELGADGALKATELNMPIPAESVARHYLHRGVFDHARLQIPEGPARSAFLEYVLTVGRIGLQDGNLKAATEEHESIAAGESRKHAQYYRITLDENENL